VVRSFLVFMGVFLPPQTVSHDLYLFPRLYNSLPHLPRSLAHLHRYSTHVFLDMMIGFRVVGVLLGFVTGIHEEHRQEALYHIP
jgi:hypothetical protein